MKTRDIVRGKIITDTLSRMSDDDRRDYILMLDRDHREVMEALSRQQDLIVNIARRVERQNWYVDFGSDLLANFTTDALIWLGKRLLK